MMDFLRPILARILASLVAGLASYVYAKWGYTLDAESQAAILSTILTIFGIVYAVVHKMINSKINPVDAARVSSAVITKQTADANSEALKNGSN